MWKLLLEHACHAGLPNSSTTNLILQWAQPNLMSAVLLEAPPPGDGSQRPQRPLLLMSLAV